MQYAPESLDEALGSLGPLGFVVGLGAFLSPEAAAGYGPDTGSSADAPLPAFLPSSIDVLLRNYTVETRTPTGIVPLPLFLTYSWLLAGYVQNANLDGPRFPPFDGSILAVTPDSVDVRAFVQDVLARPVDAWMLAEDNVLGRQIKSFIRACNVTLPGDGTPLDLAAFLRKQYQVKFFTSEEEIEARAVRGDRIWAAIVITSLPSPPWQASHSFNYTLRMPADAVPVQTAGAFDASAGLSTAHWKYYSSGFFSLQAALNEQMLLSFPSQQPYPPIVMGIPFPVAAYTYSPFLDVATNLIGLVVILSYLIPVSMLLRALVLEKEMKLREQLLTMGSTLGAYYGAVLTTHGTTFVVTGVICASLIGTCTFPHAAPSLVVALFVLFTLASLAFTLALSPFFASARVAALAGPLLFFLSSMLYFLFLVDGELVEGMGEAKLAASLLPTMAFYLAATLMARSESNLERVDWSSSFSADDGFSVGDAILMLILDVGLWLFVAWYLDQVLPSENGLQKPFYFLCTRSYWCGSIARRHQVDPMSLPVIVRDASADRGDDQSSTALLACEPLPAPLQQSIGSSGVDVCGLTKSFGGRVAVRPLSLQMAPGHVTGLLGSNGAGKTTTISMLVGLIPPSGGGATIDGHPISSEMNTIRLSLGVCPQLNVLFDSLTPTQHLQLYGELKGLSGPTLVATIEQLLSYVLLQEKRETEARHLSGGQKRKLCLAISLVGEARTVFLDEPTSGMDPHSRRSIWALLREQRAGRTMILTTHFLDEAEILSDRIAIMAEGALRCVGSPLFLKQHFGTGYSLTVTKRSAAGFDPATMLAWVRRYVADAYLVSESLMAATLRLPGDDLMAFGALFAGFDALGPHGWDALGMRGYGASCTTLEDVFLLINEQSLQRLKARQATNERALGHGPEGGQGEGNGEQQLESKRGQASAGASSLHVPHNDEPAETPSEADDLGGEGGPVESLAVWS